MSEERNPLIPRVVGAKESGEIEVPFEIYQQWCRICSDREKTLTPYKEYVEQIRKLDDRKPIKIICGALNRCVHIQKLKGG